MSKCEAPHSQGWRCTRTAGHEGPCAAVSISLVDNKILAAQAEGRLRLNRYDHGGGRLWIESKDGGCELICDLFEADTRELILSLLGVTL